MSGRGTLAGQLLALQLLLVLTVVTCVAGVSVAQAGETVHRVESRRAQATAENVAANPTVRRLIESAEPGRTSVLPSVAEGLRALAGAQSVVLARLDGTVLTSADPTQIGTRLRFGAPDVITGRAWTGIVERGHRLLISAQVPILDAFVGSPAQEGTVGRMLGIAIVERAYPSTWQRLGSSVPNLVVYLEVAGGLGVLGSLLLARRVKQQTLGLEPHEIASLVEHREAMLHGVKEGVLGLDNELRVTLVNDAAHQLLSIPEDCIGACLNDLHLDPQLMAILVGERTGTDEVVLVGERVLTLNRKPVSARGRVLGSVTTLRDRTELTGLRRELGLVRSATDTLRAQTHEFANQLHVISGLIQLNEYEEVSRFVESIASGRAELDDDITSRVRDPSLAALLVAKSTLGHERGISLRFTESSQLDRVDDDMSLDLTTVVGNLVDNAFEALSPATEPDRWVQIDLLELDREVVVTVSDSGPGVAADLTHQVFERGFSTKGSEGPVGRGMGLALTVLVCRRRGGDVTVRNEQGAVFTAHLPRSLPRTGVRP